MRQQRSELLSAAGHGRRHFLKVLTATATTGLTGCCCRAFPTPLIQTPPPNTAGLKPLLKPLKVSATGKPTPYIIDAHTHFFNGSDINAKGYFEGGVIRDLPADLQDFARLMGPLLDALTEYAPTARDEYEYLLQVIQNPPSSKPGDHPLKSKIDDHRGNIAKRIAGAMRDHRLDVEFLKFRTDQARKYDVPLLPGESTDFTEQTVLTAIDHKRRRARRQAIYRTTSPPSTNTHDPGGYLEFIGHMLSYRFMNIRDYQELYTEADDAPGVDGVFNALVDFDRWLDCPTESSREDQVRVQSLLALLSGGYVLPLVSYNPWTDIASGNDASLNLVKDAIKNYGFVGVKIYPATGFFPYGNTYLRPKLNTSQIHPDLVQLDAKLLAMFEWCAANGVPVMAHSDETAGVDVGADEFGGPTGWAALLKTMKGGPLPIVNIAHFGDDVPPLDHQDNQWPMAFAKLMAQPNGKKIYADLGYWTSLCSCDTTAGDKQTALTRLTEEVSLVPDLANKIMFGSDWFMISTIPAWEKYTASLIENLRPLQPILPFDRLFYRNVMECYGLGPGGTQRDRVLKFFNQVAGGPPRWLNDAPIG